MSSCSNSHECFYVLRACLYVDPATLLNLLILAFKSPEPTTHTRTIPMELHSGDNVCYGQITLVLRLAVAVPFYGQRNHCNRYLPRCAFALRSSLRACFARIWLHTRPPGTQRLEASRLLRAA